MRWETIPRDMLSSPINPVEERTYDDFHLRKE